LGEGLSLPSVAKETDVWYPIAPKGRREAWAMDGHEVICQKWEESERGWGTRPDGYSLHLTDEDRQAYIKGYWAGMPEEVPDEYSRPDGTPYHCRVDEETFKEVEASKNGIRRFRGPLPGSGGTDGWVPVKGNNQE